MGTYRLHTLSVEDLYKKAGRETEKKKKAQFELMLQ